MGTLHNRHVYIATPVEPLTGSDAINIINANVLKIREIDNFLPRHTGQPESGQDPDTSYLGLGYAAQSPAGVVGIVLFYFTPSLLPEEQLCFLTGAVDPLYRRRGVGTQLMTQVLTAVKQAKTKLALIASLPDRDAGPAAEFLTRFGFGELDCEVQYEGSLTGIEFVSEDPRFDLRAYNGGDPSLDEAIVDLHRRGYRRHPCVVDLTNELLALRLANPNCFYELLFHERQLIGYASFWIDKGKCYVDSLLVARQYWGSGASEELVHSVGRVATERGCAIISTISSSSNRAIISLMLKHNCHVVKATKRFCRRFTGEVAGNTNWVEPT
jgi:GNAT superfamily N-acetyltransferase